MKRSSSPDRPTSAPAAAEDAFSAVLGPVAPSAGLKLAGSWASSEADTGAGEAETPNPGTGRFEPADPRWVLAARAAEQLEGTLLSPDRRERLIRLGKVMGLDAFQSNLVIAVVQDRARHGVAPGDLLTGLGWELQVVPPARKHRFTPRGRSVAEWVVAVLLVEAAMLVWLLG